MGLALEAGLRGMSPDEPARACKHCQCSTSAPTCRAWDAWSACPSTMSSDSSVMSSFVSGISTAVMIAGLGALETGILTWAPD